MTTTNQIVRTDCHRPGAIIPSDYEYVAIEHDRVPAFGFDPSWAMAMAANRATIQAHMARTGGTYSSHEHGGNCHVCGAHCIYTVLFYHAQTNSYIRTGFDCAEKMEMCNPALFRTFRKNLENARERAAGYAKAHAVLTDHDLLPAWEIFRKERERDAAGVICTCHREAEALARSAPGQTIYDSQVRALCPLHSVKRSWEETTILDIVGKLVRFGSLSPKQIDFLRKLLADIPRKQELLVKRAEEKAMAQDAPTGRHTVTAVILTFKEQFSDAYGPSYKMLVKASAGWTAWGSVPKGIAEAQKGDTIELTATFAPTQGDAKHAFFSRPIAKIAQQIA